LEWGKDLTFLEEVWKSTGQKPKALQARPKVKPAYLPDLFTFYAIASGRRYNMGGMQPIEIADILDYCQLHGISNFEERERLFRLMTRLDTAYMAAYFKKQEAQRK
jgi:hypothetical protein